MDVVRLNQRFPPVEGLGALALVVAQHRAETAAALDEIRRRVPIIYITNRSSLGDGEAQVGEFQRLFGAPAVGDVVERSDPQEMATRLRAGKERNAARAVMAVFAVARAQSEFDLEWGLSVA